MSPILLAGATLNQTPLDWEGNLDNIIQAIAMAKEKNVDLLCLPELSITGYGSEDLFLSYWYPKKALDSLQKILPYTQDITVLVGLPCRIHSQLYNCMAVLEDREILGFVAKQFLAIDGVHYEGRWFTPWKAGEVTTIECFDGKYPFGDIIFDKHGHKYGFEICEDAWRGSKRPGHRLKKRGVDIIFNPSASHFAMGKSEQRELLVKESSKELGVAYFYVNLLGNESGRMIFDGEVLYAEEGEVLLKNKLLSFQSVQLQTIHFPAKGAKPLQLTHNSQTKNEEFMAASTLALFDYLRKSRSRGFVLSLSGGADSSTIAILVADMVKRGVEMLGAPLFLKKIHRENDISPSSNTKEIIKEIFTTAYQGTRNSSTATLNSAQNLAKSLGATFHHWTIDEEVSSYTHKIENALGRKLSWEKDDIALQNIQARARSPIIWMLANIKNFLLLSTSNRSEGDLGYATMDGDTSGSISPIAAVSKDFILQWLRWAEKEKAYEGLSYVNSLQPTAELRPQERSQTDEDDLMPYPIISAIEKLAIRDRRSPMDVYLILKEEISLEPSVLKGYIAKFFRLWSINQWKRERLAVSFHLDEFNVDPKTWYRFPVLSGGYREELALMEKLEE
ncbi:NAD(+) synthase [Cyclobacterium marinum]|uniref:Glutamine-dependent NAD(+) synthetase n=1 Tax=Cyclobacterium marinum (strain ATCC 25205 / DSM 745 / LMG 13164 / NCIMB 1802) TaxID=880070 RepID=G0IXY0_CYCMS|nr:NAD(+) synthase [Cyclobacterium marinum]AEL24313.1 NAD+ synthetase [Cyclobacterium marinum DSM 745]MBI0399015.1 NAD(+) synthase [Cyclobacterium marinum]